MKPSPLPEQKILDFGSADAEQHLQICWRDDPRPLPAELPPVLPFDENLLPAALTPWVTDTWERMQCPPDYPAVAAMVALAGVVGRKIAIAPQA